MLKFGVHLLRGIPRQAVEKNTPIKDTPYHAADIADKKDTCPWNGDMYGVDMSKPGAQEYYNSVFDLFAQWGVDFVKVDDISRPYNRHRAEIEAVRKAIDQHGPAHGFKPFARRNRAGRRRSRGEAREHVAHERRFLGQLARGSGPVRPA